MTTLASPDGRLPTSQSSGPLAARLALQKDLAALRDLRDRLTSLTLWTHAAPLAACVSETLADIEALSDRLDAKAIVAVVGGTGSGKSTLVNALAASDHAVAAGTDRPTTRSLSAIARSPEDAAVLFQAGFSPDDLAVHAPPSFPFENLILVDTPDTDSAEAAAYAPLLDRILRQADILLCLFDAANPKRKDNLDRLVRKVSTFQDKHIFLVLNRCDRIPPDELPALLADFQANTRAAWNASTARTFCISARAHLQDPAWPDGEHPLGAPDDFPALLSALRDISGTHFADARLARARFLRTQAETLVRDDIAACGDWPALRRSLEAFDDALARDLLQKALAKTADASLDDALADAITSRWWGPVGTYLSFGTRLRGALARLNPFRFVHPSPDGRLSTGQPTLSAPSVSWPDARPFAVEQWPPLAADLLAHGFTPDLLDPEAAITFAPFADHLRQALPALLSRAIARIARRYAHPLLVLLANLPFLALAAFSLWQIASTYLRGTYLPHDYYVQTAFLLLFLWLIPAWLVQALLRRAASALPRALDGRLSTGQPSPSAAPRLLPVLPQVRLLASLLSTLR